VVPQSAQSWNPYAYVRNAPLSATDPSGFEAEEIVVDGARPSPPDFEPLSRQSVVVLGTGIAGYEGADAISEPPAIEEIVVRGRPEEKSGFWDSLVTGLRNAAGGVLHAVSLGLYDPPWADSDSIAFKVGDWGSMLIPVGAVVGAVGKLGRGARWVVKCAFCFVAGTEVLTAEGLVSIEEIEPGDLVAAYDEATGETVFRRVEATHQRIDSPVLDLEWVDEGGERTSIGVTAEHPFHVEGRGWTEAGSLAAGDRIRTLAGSPVVVSALVPRQTRHVTFNLTVADFATYFVTGDGVLVHNCGRPRRPPKFPRLWPRKLPHLSGLR
jgi:hypothetical protein